MKDPRVPFDKAQKKLQTFLKGIRLPQRILWLTGDRVTGHTGKVWIYQPATLEDPASSRAFYESLRIGTAVSLRIDVLCEWEGASVCFVEDCGGESCYLNFGAGFEPVEVEAVHTRSQWLATRFFLGGRRDRHPVTHRRITPASESA